MCMCMDSDVGTSALWTEFAASTKHAVRRRKSLFTIIHSELNAQDRVNNMYFDESLNEPSTTRSGPAWQNFAGVLQDIVQDRRL